MSEKIELKLKIKQKLAALASQGFRLVWSGVFFILSVIQYVAYFEGLSLLVQGVLNRWWVIMALCVTYMFRLDFIAAVFGLYGAWKVWHFPLWIAVMLTAFFGSMSFAINYGPGKKPLSFFKQIMPAKKSGSKSPDPNSKADPKG